MIDVPFWVKSPSPFTLIFWLVLALWGNLHIKGKIKYKRFPLLAGLTDSIFVVGLMAFSYDTLWVVCQGLKFGSLYPADLFDLFKSLLRNLGFLGLCTVYCYPLFKKKIIGIKKITLILLGIEVVYFGLWFMFAPNISWTDWTFAIRYNFPNDRVVQAFIISHVIGKLIQGLIFISLWRTEK